MLARHLNYWAAGVLMKLTNLGIKSAVAIAALTLAATPAFAQRDHGRSSQGGRTEGRAVQRSEAPRAQPQRAEAPRAEAPRPQPQAQAPRAEAPRSLPAPRVETRTAPTPRVETRTAPAPANRYEGRYDGRRGGNVATAPRAVPRSEVIVPRGERGVVSGSRGYAPRVYSPRYGGSYSYRPYIHSYGYRPYVFRPRTRLSFGLYLGYGVPYAYVYSYPVPVYGYGAPSAPVYITPNSSLYGGITLEITPSDAQVFVDGQYVGEVQDFDGTTGPLNMTTGQHRIQLSAPGYDPLTMDVNVAPGQLVPYRGDLQPVRY
jgi:hypothetical protein